MKRNALCLGLSFVIALFLAFPSPSKAEIAELKEGMTQGDFALWMVQAIGALGKLPPGAKGDDAIKFLGGNIDPRSGQSSGLGIIPEGGWQKDDPMTKELLTGLLEDPKDGAGLSWDDLVDKVRKRIQSIFDNRKLGVFRVTAATPSLPAA